MERIKNAIKLNGGVISTSELHTRSEYNYVLKAAEQGKLIRIRHGVYSLPEAMLNTMVDIERIVPGGVVCLYNAWAFYRLSTVVPPAFCVAIAAKRKVSIPDIIPVNLYYWKAENLDFGIAEQRISGYTIRMTDLERSVCDAVKYRNKTGTEVCAEVIRNYIKRDDRNFSRLIEYARKLRVLKTLNNYLEISIE